MANLINQTLGTLEGLKQDPPVVKANPRNNGGGNDYTDILFHWTMV
jgi:hypothetical protein